ncbi:MAG: serine/threonine-protein kinase [Acidobacteria bacterium]|nr:MAG: serine/threonine-protein kinase [Acidobacteriota bacterium]
MTLNAGTRLGAYEILSVLGAGGMGEVYRARDTRLDRTVAIKVLPQDLSNDPTRRQRFEREARAIAALNHPHICVLHDIGREGQVDYLVLEYLEGETLARHLERGPLPTSDLLRVGIEISEGLERAHRHGLVHRDLKPGNIMLTKMGSKLLDFGLAKAVEAEPAAEGVADVATASAGKPLTARGAVMGTYHYMAPEQLEGRGVDVRSDIFSFAAVLYEMATGQKAFEGKSAASIIAAVLHDDPVPITDLQPMRPPALDRLVRACLAKDPDDRYQSAHDVRLQLECIRDDRARAGVAAPLAERRKTRQRLAWGVAAACLALAVGFAYAWFGGRPAQVQPVRSLIAAPEKYSFAFNGPFGAPVLSPDGKLLVFPAADASGKESLWVRPLNSLTAQQLQGTENASFPFWAPDSRQLGFFQDQKFKKIDVTSGPPTTVCDAPSGRGGAWSKDGIIIMSPETSGGLSSVPVAGGTPIPIASGEDPRQATTGRWPALLPDGRHFVFLSGDLTAPGTARLGIYLGEIGSSERRFLFQADSGALYVPPGYLLFLRGDTLTAQRFDADGQNLRGGAFPVALHVPSPLQYRLGLFSVSQTGTLIYATGTGESGGQLVWVNTKGIETGKVGEPGPTRPRLSPDGQRVAYVTRNPEGINSDIWLMDLARGVQTRFTFGPGNNSGPLWSPDGARIAYASWESNSLNIFIKNTSGAGDGEPLLRNEDDKTPTDWSRDGKYILYTSVAPKGKANPDVWVLPLFGDRKPFPYLQTRFIELGAVFSPDSGWVAYVSDESGKPEVYVSPFPLGQRKWQVSQGGGVLPEWSHDGGTLFYVANAAPVSKLMEARVKRTRLTVEISAPREVFHATGTLEFSVAPDGRRFLVSKSEQAEPPPLTLVTYWTSELNE